MNKNFNWSIDSENYLHNKKTKKITIKDFIKKIIKYLDTLKKEEWKNVRNMSNNHSCYNLGKQQSEKAKTLNRHLEKINTSKGINLAEEIEPFQIRIPFKNKAFRVFGYIENDIYNLVYLDPDHEIYPD